MSLLSRLETAIAPRLYRLVTPEVAVSPEPTGSGLPGETPVAPLAEAQRLPGFRGMLLSGLSWLDETAHRLRYAPLSVFEPTGGGQPGAESASDGAVDAAYAEALAAIEGSTGAGALVEPTGGAGASGLIDTPVKELVMKPLRFVASVLDSISGLLGFPGTGLAAPKPKPKPAPAPAPKPAPKPAPTPAPKPVAPGGTVTVQKGDTLSKIAQRTLGNGDRWREIYELNRDQLSNPNLITPGQVLKLPGGGNKPAPAPKPGNFPLNSAQIASALGVNAGNVAKYWPAIYEAFRKRGMADTPTLIAALATIRVEVGGTFAPISEYASGWAYEGRKDLGNTQSGDGPRFKGRGFIQLTGRANYTTYGKKFGIDLAGHPELALRADVAAEVLAQYFQDRNIDDAARAGDWTTVRKRVNGGTNGWSTFIGAVNSLKRAT